MVKANKPHYLSYIGHFGSAHDLFVSGLNEGSELVGLLDKYIAKPVLSLLTPETIKEFRDQINSNSKLQNEYISYIAHISMCLTVNGYGKDRVTELFEECNHYNFIPTEYGDVMGDKQEYSVDIKMLYLKSIFEIANVANGVV